MSCVTRNTKLDDIERLKRLVIRQGRESMARPIGMLYSRQKEKNDIPLRDESFLIYVSYPSIHDMMDLAQTMCAKFNVDDCMPIANVILQNSDSQFVDIYFALLLGAWMSVNKIIVDLAFIMDEKSAKGFLETAWTHAPSHNFSSSDLAAAVKLDVSFEGYWDTSRFGGVQLDGMSIESMVEDFSYAGEPVSNVLGRLKKQRFFSFEKRCQADLKKACFETNDTT